MSISRREMLLHTGLLAGVTAMRRFVLRKGRLWIDGMMPLEAAGDRFNLRDNPHSPEWIQFGEVVNGRCMRLKLSGEDLWRVATA